MNDEWPPERAALLAKLWPTHSAAEIAKQLGEGVTRCAVIAKAHRMKLAKKALPTRPRTIWGPPLRGPSR